MNDNKKFLKAALIEFVIIVIVAFAIWWGMYH